MNSGVKKFKELYPLLVFHEPKSENHESMTLCAWLGDEYTDMEPPAPTDTSVTILKTKPLTVYAKYVFLKRFFSISIIDCFFSKCDSAFSNREFGGYALTYWDFVKELNDLNEEMTVNRDTTKAVKWIQAIYDSFYNIDTRRNEVIVEVV